MSELRLPRPGECRDCAEPIRFVKVHTGRIVPVNPKPDPDHGNVCAQVMSGRLVGYVVSAERPADTAMFPLRFRPHFATCPAIRPPKPAPKPSTSTDVGLF